MKDMTIMTTLTRIERPVRIFSNKVITATANTPAKRSSVTAPRSSADGVRHPAVWLRHRRLLSLIPPGSSSASFSGCKASDSRQGGRCGIASPDAKGVEESSSRHAPLCRGFTLVELLVVIAIIGVLVALLLPAVQAVREASRRMTCQNNFRQLGIALHNYHSQFSVFPPGSLNEWSWNARILPQLEQKNVYERFAFGLEPFEDGNNQQLAHEVPVLLCPSDPHGDSVHESEPLGGLRFAHTNYLGSIDSGSKGGMFGYYKPTAIRDVRDGTSQTLMVGERGVVDDGEDTHGWWTWGAATSISASQEFREGDHSQPSDINHWWSYHSGGSQFLFVDGSVHFLPYSTDGKTFQALGTRNGGEIVGEF